MNISFGQKFRVSSANNTPDAVKQFNAYCKIKSTLAGKTIFTSDKDSCTLDINDRLSSQVEEYCKDNNINYSKLDTEA